LNIINKKEKKRRKSLAGEPAEAENPLYHPQNRA